MKLREILTYPLTKDQFWAEFEHFLEYFQAKDVLEGSVLFGYAWGIEYYPSKQWTPEMIPLAELKARVLELEKRELGEFGYDDLFVELAGVEFRFCNDMDVHIGFNKHQALIEDFYSRWESMGYSPAEWIKNQEHGPGERVRGGGPDA